MESFAAESRGFGQKRKPKMVKIDCLWPYFDVIGARDRCRPATSRYVNKNIFENQKIAI